MRNIIIILTSTISLHLFSVQCTHFQKIIVISDILLVCYSYVSREYVQSGINIAVRFTDGTRSTPLIPTKHLHVYRIQENSP